MNDQSGHDSLQWRIQWELFQAIQPPAPLPDTAPTTTMTKTSFLRPRFIVDDNLEVPVNFEMATISSVKPNGPSHL